MVQVAEHLNSYKNKRSKEQLKQLSTEKDTNLEGYIS